MLEGEGSADRQAQSEVIAVLLLVATVLVLSATVYVQVDALGREVRSPSAASVTAETGVVDFDAEGDCPGTTEELVLNVTLVDYWQADEIFVVVHDESGKRLKTVWQDVGQDDVGDTKTLANEKLIGPVDVDIGGGSDYALCAGDRVTFEIYGRTDGSRQLLQRIDT